MERTGSEFLTWFVGVHGDTTSETESALGADAHALWRLGVAALDLKFAVYDAHPPADIRNALVGLALVSLDKELVGLTADFFLGRYAEAGRTLRFLWEHFFRAFHADEYDAVHPDADDGPGPTGDDKLTWLRGREDARAVSWNDVILPGLQRLFPDETADSLRGHFRLTWDRLNSVVHPSVAHTLSGMDESTRLVFNHFDEALARQLLADAQEVLSLVFAVIVRTFPGVIPAIQNEPDLFADCPQVRSMIPA